ncbi:hypothetical protein [Erwinia psidii]|uniref:Lipoprotein n=1 Tax=Erwinia psidii TaxID=69224 RepID=A0A3N6SIE4_9GAMM|nr:hypothetical protein [Erwinia psidii]MCX8957919.1 hypothetical protein [Erwinia psidii]MCX8960970.1 hypothetical protein [Erwinia psidii]RQM38531.1 hypothetical protein EB241_09965 [Erwinia psidii]
MRRLFFVLSFFLLSACSLQAEFTPEGVILNDATVGIPYYNQINIFGGIVLSYDIYGKQVIAGDINPDNLGLHLQYCDEDEFNNCIQIRGTPTKAGIAKVRVHGGLGGGMLSKSGEFDKTYTITIKHSEGSS